MTTRAAWTRRHILGATLATTGLGMRPVAAQETENDDREHGGTGVEPPDREGSDRGIGGTGVIGTIRGFGSIVVNDLHVTFPRNVAVRIDGRPARLRDLAIGHVVQVFARRNNARLSTGLIEAVSEVSGPIDMVGPDALLILGQKVVLPDARLLRRWQARSWVSVSGLRRLDGTIMASLVERRPPGTAHLAGVPRLEQDGAARIGDLAVHGVPLDLVGQRLQLSGHVSDGKLIVGEARPQWTELLANQPDHLSFEDYIASDDSKVRFGSGLPSAANLSVTGLSGETRAVVSASVSPGGRIQVFGIRAEGHGQSSNPSRTPARRDTSPSATPRKQPETVGASANTRHGNDARPRAGDRNAPAGAPSAHGPGKAGGGGPSADAPGSGRGSHR